MGNVHASTSPPPPLTTVPEPPSTPKVTSEPVEDGKSRLSTMEELHKKCKDIFPMPFDGARIVFNRGLSNHFQINHTATMSSLQPTTSGYKFGATYVGTQIVGPGEAYPVLLGDIDPSGNLNANMLCQFHPRLRTKAVVQIQDSKTAGYQVSNDYRGDNYTASVILGNFDPVTFSGMSIFHYLQPVSPTVDLGAELAVQFGPAIPDGIISALSVAGRYTSPNNFILSGTFSPSQLHCCYYQKASDQLQYGVEVDTNIKMRESYAKFGYQVDLPKMDATFKGSISSDFGITGVYEKKLAPLPLILTLSGHIVHGRNPLYRFGVGLTLG